MKGGTTIHDRCFACESERIRLLRENGVFPSDGFYPTLTYKEGFFDGFHQGVLTNNNEMNFSELMLFVSKRLNDIEKEFGKERFGVLLLAAEDRAKFFNRAGDYSRLLHFVIEVLEKYDKEGKFYRLLDTALDNAKVPVERRRRI